MQADNVTSIYVGRARRMEMEVGGWNLSLLTARQRHQLEAIFVGLARKVGSHGKPTRSATKKVGRARDRKKRQLRARA